MKAIGIILAGGKNERLGELNTVRATSALPIGSCYRVIDFTISNMSNTDIKKIAVITQHNSSSLHDHLSSSKWWDLGRKHGGLYVFSPFLQNDNSFWFRGTADSMYQNLSFLRRSNEPYAVITSGNCVFKMDFSKLIASHAASGADITIAAKDVAGMSIDPREFGVLTLDEELNIVEFDEKPIETEGTVVSMGIYVLSRTLLIELLESVVSDARYDFVKDILIHYRKKLSYKAYMFDHYWMAINSIKSYYQANMDFLRKEVRDDLVHQMPYIATKPKDEPPAKFNFRTQTSNCLIGSGSILNGKAVDSVIFRRVFTGENSFIRNSVIMEGCHIGNNCVVENAILDKDVTLSDNKQIRSTSDIPAIVRKGTLV